jgi:hypothetical protein
MGGGGVGKGGEVVVGEKRGVGAFPDMGTALIRRDQIKVEDLAGHLAGNRLLALAPPGPGPGQLLGLSEKHRPALAYRLVDEVIAPPGEAEANATTDTFLPAPSVGGT